MRSWGDRAVVVGGSLAGLLAARVLADRYGEVVLVERDRLTDEGVPAPRKGVPQGRQVHGLLPRGALALERLFPGILDGLEADGAVRGDLWPRHALVPLRRLQAPGPQRPTRRVADPPAARATCSAPLPGAAQPAPARRPRGGGARR